MNIGDDWPACHLPFVRISYLRVLITWYRKRLNLLGIWIWNSLEFLGMVYCIDQPTLLVEGAGIPPLSEVPLGISPWTFPSPWLPALQYKKLLTLFLALTLT